jgi:hypothetical protein
MKTRRWIVITILALALSMPVSLVSAAPSAFISVTTPLPNPASISSEGSFALIITVTDTNPGVADAEIPAVKGIVLRQGTPTNPNPGGGTLACSEVKLIPSISSPVLTIDESVLPNFELRLTNPSDGVYTIQVGYSGYLASEVTTTIPPSRDVGTTTLCGGDVNADRVINILDIGLIIGKFGETNVEVRSDLSNPPMLPADCADPDEPADINDNGIVNIGDLTIAAGNWGLVGRTRWDTSQCTPR